jgi:hypothetical protein
MALYPHFLFKFRPFAQLPHNLVPYGSHMVHKTTEAARQGVFS